MNGFKRMDEKINFIKSSISDIQATIRAIDTKIGFALLIVLFPLTNLGKVQWHLINISNKNPKLLFTFLSLLFCLLWLASLVGLIRAISAIDNPTKHIINNSKFSGTYYAGGVYTFGLSDVFSNRDVIKASIDVDSFFSKIPAEKGAIAKELSFEQLKLVYIRDIKIKRLNFSLFATYIWLTIGLLIYCCSKFIS